jgi:hypothetical protein
MLLASLFDLDVIKDFLFPAAYLTSEAILHHPLICCSCILEAEGHDLITKTSYGGIKPIFSLSCFFNLIWLYPEYASKKESLAHPGV